MIKHLFGLCANRQKWLPNGWMFGNHCLIDCDFTINFTITLYTLFKKSPIHGSRNHYHVTLLKISCSAPFFLFLHYLKDIKLKISWNMHSWSLLTWRIFISLPYFNWKILNIISNLLQHNVVCFWRKSYWRIIVFWLT